MSKMQTLAQALQRMLSTIHAPMAEECLDLDEALDRILASDVYSPHDVPAFDNSAMDGYAVRFADVTNGGRYRVVGQSFAGHPFNGDIPAGCCVQITTGALVPAPLDSVLMQEAVSKQSDADGDYIEFTEQPDAGQHVRLRGSEIAQGQLVLKKGQRLGPLHLGVLATLGIARVAVYPQLTVGVLSSGDEIKQAATPLGLGDVYDSNRIVVKAILQRLGYQVVDYGWVPDDPQQLMDVFQRAASEVQALITSGGVSVGDADHTRHVLETLGQMNFWQVAIKPGKPFVYGRLGTCEFFGLPGNPVSAVMTLEQLVLPALAKRAGWVDALLVDSLSHSEAVSADAAGMTATACYPLVSATVQQPLRKKPGRMDFQRVKLSYQHQQAVVEPVGLDSSGMLTSLLHANAWTWLEQHRADVATGEAVWVQLKSPWLY